MVDSGCNVEGMICDETLAHNLRSADVTISGVEGECTTLKSKSKGTMSLMIGGNTPLNVDNTLIVPNGHDDIRLTLGNELGASFIDHAPVWYRDGHEVRSVSRPAFKALADDGEVDLSTPVFDTSLTRIGDYRAGALETPARGSWHGRAFFGATAGA